MEPEIKDIIYAILLSSTTPVTQNKLTEILEIEQSKITQALNQLLSSKHPVLKLVKIAGGYQFQINTKFAPWILKAKGGQAQKEKVTKIMLEALAIIAYRQPLTRVEIEDIRGGGNIYSVLQQLEERNLIQIIGYTGVHKRTALYGTTKN